MAAAAHAREQFEGPYMVHDVWDISVVVLAYCCTFFRYSDYCCTARGTRLQTTAVVMFWFGQGLVGRYRYSGVRSIINN